MRTIGLIGGMSWESTALYYRFLNEGVRDRLGGLHSAPIILSSYDFAQIAALQAANDWQRAAQVLADTARRLQDFGAQALVLCTNTMHEVASGIERAISIPLLHIVDPTANAMRAAGAHRPALLATRFTMEREFYVGRLRERFGIDAVVPDASGREVIHNGIYQELCRGIVSPATKAAYLAEIDELLARGADSVIFGCTEVGLLLDAADVSVPVFDTTILHAAAAVDWLLHDAPVCA